MHILLFKTTDNCKTLDFYNHILVITHRTEDENILFCQGLLKNLSQKCLKHWNAVISTSVDERNNATSANQQSSSTKLQLELKIGETPDKLH